MTRRSLWGWVALAAGASLGAAVLLHFGGLLTPRGVVEQVSCENVVAGCIFPQQNLRITFDRQPQPMQPFRLKVEILTAREVHASFAMRDMQMGLNRYRLLAEGAGVWKADITLPICIHGRSDWIMTLDVDGRLYQLPFSSG